MGCAGAQDAQRCDANEYQHEVMLSAYEIDRTEVTQADYAACVAAGACVPSASSYHNPIANPRWPAVGLDHAMAALYCAWVGKRLPTEAEWEKAARGEADTRVYPWGDENPACDVHAVVRGLGGGDDCSGPLEPRDVGSLTAGDSPYDVHDMAGNVWEWVHDWYGASYYETSDSTDPQGPSDGTFRILRGGGFMTGDSRFIRISNRHYLEGTGDFARLDTHGVRCARTLP